MYGKEKAANQTTDLCFSLYIRFIHFPRPQSISTPSPIHITPFPTPSLSSPPPQLQTKTSACELVHSALILVIGRSATTPEAARLEAPKSRFFRRVFPVVLRLCASPEVAIRNLFRTLAFPLIRWLTSGRRVSFRDMKAGYFYVLVE